MTKNEVIEVINKFSEEITEFDENILYSEIYNTEAYARNIIGDIIAKLKED